MAKKNTAGRTKVALSIALLFGPALFLIFIATRSCEHKFSVLEDFGEAIDYTFVDAKGDSISSKDFKGHNVLVTTLQVTCPEDCAISWWHLNQGLYQRIKDQKHKDNSLKIVSFVTDGKGNPVEDVSSVFEMLQDRVEGFDPEVWYVASGDAKALYDFENNGETLLQEGDEYYGGHAFQELMLLLDRENHLRMALSGASEGMIRRMKEHIALLHKQYDKEAAKKENQK